MATKIEQLLNDIKSLSITEAAELAGLLETEFGVSSMMAVASAGAAVADDAGAAKAEEKSEYKVELLDGGPEKIKTIKALRQVKKDLGLTEAKKMVEDAPVVVSEAAPKEEAMALKEALEAAGAKVKLS